MPQNDLTPARLRALIAAATKHGINAYPEDTPYTFLDWGGPGGRLRKVDADLIVYLVNNAPALADDMEKAELLEWAFNQGLVNIIRLTPDSRLERLTSLNSLDALRAAKEAADA